MIYFIAIFLIAAGVFTATFTTLGRRKQTVVNTAVPTVDTSTRQARRIYLAGLAPDQVTVARYFGFVMALAVSLVVGVLLGGGLALTIAIAIAGGFAWLAILEAWIFRRTSVARQEIDESVWVWFSLARVSADAGTPLDSALRNSVQVGSGLVWDRLRLVVSQTYYSGAGLSSELHNLAQIYGSANLAALASRLHASTPEISRALTRNSGAGSRGLSVLPQVAIGLGLAIVVAKIYAS